jgi:hypothetical protein
MDVSGMDISGTYMVDISGTYMDVSGMDISGTYMDVSGMDISGVNITPEIEIIPEPTTLSIEDILNESEIVRQKELVDKAALESIWNISIPSLRTLLMNWAASGFPNAMSIHEIQIQAPAICSDGVSRSLGDYIQYCSGKSIQEHISLLQAKLTDIVVAFSYTGASIRIVVSRS